MDRSYWHKQTTQKPLFPQLVWSRPENRLTAGKLLIIGGNAHGFAAPAEAYALSVAAGIGTARALLPQAIQKIVGILVQQADFTASTPSGSFSQRALSDFLELAQWSDGTLFAGDLGRNAETAILVEKFLSKSPVAVTLTKDAVDYAVSLPQAVLTRDETLLVLSLAQLQRLGVAAKMPTAITFGMDLLQLVGWLHLFTESHKPHIVVRHLDTLFVAVNGRVSTTRLPGDYPPVWRLGAATRASVWWLQNPTKPFEAITTSLVY